MYFDNAEKIHKIFTEFYMTPTNYLDKNLRWVQVMVDMLIRSVRHYLAGLYCFHCWRFCSGDSGAQKEIVCYGGRGGWCASNDPYTFVFGAGDDMCGMAAVGFDRK